MNYKLKCYCNGVIEVTEEDFGGDVECPRCGSDMYVPETAELIELHNQDTVKSHEEMRFTGKVRIMITDECGHDKCIIDEAGPENLDWVIKGVEASYPEARVFTEPVENQHYLAEQFMLDDRF